MHSAFGSRLHILIHASPILIHALGFRLSAPYLNTCIPYLNTCTRLSALGSISYYIADSAANQNREPINFVNQSESSITSPESSANQNRVLRNPSRHYVTPESSRRLEDPSGLSAQVGLP